MSKEFKDFMLSPEAGAFLQTLSNVIEKAFDRAEKRDQQRHDEAMKRLEIQQVEAEARAEKLRAEAESIRARVNSNSSTSFKRSKSATHNAI